MDQWNIGVQRELPGNTVIDANYVGSVGRHLDWSVAENIPSPGPGADVQARRPFPYMQAQWFDQSVGNSRYNALQVTVNKHASHGVTYLAAYTLSHSDDDGCVLGGNCNSTNPYDRSRDYGTSDLDLKHVFSFSFTAQSPYTHSPNRAVSIAAGGWALNGILQLSSGLPYTVTIGSDPENIGGGLQERPNVVGDANKGPGIRTQKQWFNTSAFERQPEFTYGNEGVNPYRSDWGHNLDLSLFRRFGIGLGERRYFEFRAEAFNVLNNVVFGIPEADFSSTKFGQATSQQNTSRQLQMALKLYF